MRTPSGAGCLGPTCGTIRSSLGGGFCKHNQDMNKGAYESILESSNVCHWGQH